MYAPFSAPCCSRESLRLRLEDEGIDQPRTLDFHQLHRSDPLVIVLAEHLLEEALQGGNSIAARCAVTVTASVKVLTTLYLFRLRHQLSYVRRNHVHQMMVEETVPYAVQGRRNPQWISDSRTDEWLQCQPSGNLSEALTQQELQKAMEFLHTQTSVLEQMAQQRAETLLADHQRVREAARDIGQYRVTPCLPVDLMGVYVLLPDSL